MCVALRLAQVSAPDGRRYLMLTKPTPPLVTELHVLHGLFKELKSTQVSRARP